MPSTGQVLSLHIATWWAKKLKNHQCGFPICMGGRPQRVKEGMKHSSCSHDIILQDTALGSSFREQCLSTQPAQEPCSTLDCGLWEGRVPSNVSHAPSGPHGSKNSQ